MFNEQDYKAAFSRITASDEMHRRILNMANEKKKHFATGFVSKILIAAVMISLLAVTAFASEEVRSWFQSYFSAESEAVFSQDQMEFIRDREREIQQSETYDGYTVTLESYFADSMSAWFKLKIQCPEGVQFCDSPWGTYPVSWGLIRKSDGVDLGGGEIWRLEDPDRTDNVGYIQFHFRYQILEQDSENLLSESYYLLRIEGLQDIYLEGDEIVYDEVVSGIWEFDIDFSGMEHMEAELIEEPLEYLMIADDNKEIPKKVPIKITSFKLYPMYAVIWYEYMDEAGYATPDDFAPCTVVFRDGSSVILDTSAVMSGVTEFQTTVPLILSEVDYVQLPGGTKLPMPE